MSNSEWGARVRLEPTPKPSNSDTGRFASHSWAPRCSTVDAHTGLAMDIPGLSEMRRLGSKLRCALFPSVVKVQFGSGSGPFFPNTEPELRFGSGISPNLNLNPRFRFRYFPNLNLNLAFSSVWFGFELISRTGPRQHYHSRSRPTWDQSPATRTCAIHSADLDSTQEGSTRCTQSPHPTMCRALGRLQDSMHAVENSKMQRAGSSFKIAMHNLCAMHQVVCEQGGDAHNHRLDHDAWAMTASSGQVAIEPLLSVRKFAACAVLCMTATSPACWKTTLHTVVCQPGGFNGILWVQTWLP
ncbi:hypothetical protein B0H10DRAFT_1962143 [Mycena sp. CBHHK59/15]|nr:hypothetical protein B0H10DRAFT_1962143 [Mycena sp. CBHHK59/15]